MRFWPMAGLIAAAAAFKYRGGTGGHPQRKLVSSPVIISLSTPAKQNADNENDVISTPKNTPRLSALIASDFMEKPWA